MSYDELILAKEAIAPKLKLKCYLLRKYSMFGYVIKYGKKWVIKKSVASFLKKNNNYCLLYYCGDPSIIWGLYRRMHGKAKNHILPKVNIVNKRGELPYLSMEWDIEHTYNIKSFLTRKGVLFQKELWNH